MTGRVTRKKPEVPLTEEQRHQLNEARAVVAELSEREPAPEALTELGYELRMSRGRACEIAVAAIATGEVNFTTVTSLAAEIHEFIWKGTHDAEIQD